MESYASRNRKKIVSECVKEVVEQLTDVYSLGDIRRQIQYTSDIEELVKQAFEQNRFPPVYTAQELAPKVKIPSNARPPANDGKR